MQKETPHMHKYLSRGKQLLKTPYYMYCIYQRIEKKYNAFSSLSNLCKCIVYPSTSLTDSDQYLANFSAYKYPNSLCCSLGKLLLFFYEFHTKELCNRLRLIFDCMHHLYTWEYATNNITLPWNLHQAWGN